MKMLARAGLVLCSILLAGPSIAQVSTLSDVVTAPDGTKLPAVPVTIMNHSCNGGLGGLVGYTYSGVLCSLPGSGGGGGGAVTAAPNSYSSGFSPDLGTPSDTPYTGTGNSTLIGTLRGAYAVDAATAVTAHTDAQAITSAASGAKGTLAAPSFTTGQADQRLVCLAGSGASCNTAVSIAANASATAATFAISATYGVSCFVTGPVKLQLAQPDGSYADSGLAFSGNGSGGIFITAGPSGQAARIVDTSGAANTALCQATS